MRIRSRRRERLTVARLEHTLTFGSNAAAFDYACRFMLLDIRAGAPIAALVLAARYARHLNLAAASNLPPLQTALLSVSSRDGGFQIVARTLGPIGPRLDPGDLVAWRPERYIARAVAHGGDPRCGWTGRIVAVIEPEWAEGAGWKIRESFR